ncbi:uncharacterized protein I206_101280 [Kwoniella pini CBS 10737]|uniref:N-acetyltransferase domain-containing protein n=1 Tax=Kwoniella pini CBS 10737 TaxID=1296096 RepID=A0A1B9IBH8_9TREE|nr:uncharacterized protein I206_00043 [Kwoniella pini CBS 10737]OCF52747.1 hypothetical protein I206_00043 [Kwoniella pini CBS 10737]
MPSHSLIQDGPNGPYIQLPNHNLKLTLWQETDVNDAVALFNHPDIGRWSITRPYPYTTQDYKYISSAIPSLEKLALSLINESSPDLKSISTAPIFPLSALRNNKGKVVGFCSIGYSQKEKGSWEIAYDLHPDLQRKGIATVMVKSILDFVKGLGVERVIAFVESTNIPSASLLRRCNFTFVEHKSQNWAEENGCGSRLLNWYEIILQLEPIPVK